MNDSEQIKGLLKKNLEISKKTYKLAKKIRQTQQFARWFKLVKWSVIIALALGLYYYIQPFIGNFLETFDQIKTDFSVFGDTIRPR